MEHEKEILICTCIDAVLVICQDIVFHHVEPLQDITAMHSEALNSTVFLKTDAHAEKIVWFSKRMHERYILWQLAESSPPKRCWSFIQILAIGTVETLAAFRARSSGDVRLDIGIRELRCCLRNIYGDTQETRDTPSQLSSNCLSYGCKDGVQRSVIYYDSDHIWKESSKNESSQLITIRASSRQMLWLLQYPSFSSLLLRGLKSPRDATEIWIERLVALEVASSISIFCGSLEEWFTDVNRFIQELERMLIEGVTVY